MNAGLCLAFCDMAKDPPINESFLSQMYLIVGLPVEAHINQRNCYHRIYDPAHRY